MDSLSILMCLAACASLGSAQIITIPIEDEHLLVEGGSPEVTFSADIEPAVGADLYGDLQFFMGTVYMAAPGLGPDGPVLRIINTAYGNFEVLDTTLPRVSVKLSEPEPSKHTQTYKWNFISVNVEREFVMIVSEVPQLTLTDEIHENETTQIQCSVKFGQLITDRNPENRIGLAMTIDSSSISPDSEDFDNIDGLITKTITYNRTFQRSDNGIAIQCVATLAANTQRSFATDAVLDILHLPGEDPISFGITPTDNVYAVGEQINCTAEGNPGPTRYAWTDLEHGQPQVQGQTLDLTEGMVANGQFWMCEAFYADADTLHANLSFSVVPVGEKPEESTDGGGDDTVAIAVSVVVVVLVLVVAGVAGLLWYTKRYQPAQKNKSAKANNNSSEPKVPPSQPPKPSDNEAFDTPDPSYAIPHQKTPSPRQAKRPESEAPGVNEAYEDTYDVASPQQPDTMV